MSQERIKELKAEIQMLQCELKKTRVAAREAKAEAKAEAEAEARWAREAAREAKVEAKAAWRAARPARQAAARAAKVEARKAKAEAKAVRIAALLATRPARQAAAKVRYAKRQIERRKDRKDKGICVNCGKEPARPEGSTCETCLERSRKYYKPRRPIDPNKALARRFFNLNLHARYRVLISAGLAPQGVSPPAALEPFWILALTKAKESPEVLGRVRLGISLEEEQ